jgi:hypothetical protein
MPLLDDLKSPFAKMILSSSLHGLLSDDLALISFTDSRTGKKLAFVVHYQRESRFIRIVCPRKESCWGKFTYGSPIEITIKGVKYRGWAEIIDDQEEMLREWKALFRHSPDKARELGVNISGNGEIDVSGSATTLNEFAILRIDISGER